jgi:large subunit ribosomal protein L21
MYAVIETGGKQLKVTPGEIVRVERLEVEEGRPIAFERVLLVSDEKGLRVGTPLVAGVKVVGTCLGDGRAAKVIIFKKKKRKQYRRTKGHRQFFTAVRIDRIEA